MSFHKLLEKGKAKIKEYSSPSSQYPGQSHQHQAYPGNAYPSQPQLQSPYGQYPPQPGPYPQQPPYSQQPSYNAPPAAYPPYSPPLNQYGQYGPPTPQYPHLAPPVPQHSKPATTPPPLPQHPSQHQLPSCPPPTNNAYWTAQFSPSIPVTHNFRHELGAHGWGNNESQNYTADPSNSFHTPDARLVVRAIAQNGQYTSARLTSHQTLARRRGYLTATLIAPCASGIWPAFWLLPADPFTWPVDGEVDIFEAWNGDPVNHSCLHWGHFNGEDWNKHRVMETPVPDLGAGRPHTFGLAWIEEDGMPEWRGRLVWYIDGRPVMKASIPQGTRRMEDFRILINVAMGGNVCQGKLPESGAYDLVVSDLKMCEEPVGGWSAFEMDWECAVEGKMM